MDSLHRYFDYSLRHPGAGPSRPSARTNMAVLPYALLNLAVLHHRFGQLSHTAQANSEPSPEPFIYSATMCLNKFSKVRAAPLPNPPRSDPDPHSTIEGHLRDDPGRTAERGPHLPASGAGVVPMALRGSSRPSTRPPPDSEPQPRPEWKAQENQTGVVGLNSRGAPRQLGMLEHCVSQAFAREHVS